MPKSYQHEIQYLISFDYVDVITKKLSLTHNNQQFISNQTGAMDHTENNIFSFINKKL